MREKEAEMGSEGWKLVKVSQGSYQHTDPLFDSLNEKIYCCSGKDVFIYRVDNGKLVGRLKHFEIVTNIQQHPHELSQVITGVPSGVVCFWNVKGEVVVRTVDLKQSKLLFFQLFPSETPEELSCFFSAYTDETSAQLLTCSICHDSQQPAVEILEKMIPNASQAVSLAATQCAWIWKNNAFLRGTKKGSKKTCYQVNTTHFTCVKYHERNDSLAAGNNIGMIYIWEEASKGISRLSQKIHWHHTAVISLAWSLEGSSVYSGASERVLVKSVLHHQGRSTQKFLPRFLGSIERIVVSEDGTNVALVLGDNCKRVLMHHTRNESCVSAIQLLNSQMEVTNQIQGLILSKDGKRVGLHCDWSGIGGELTKGTLWTNSIPGHIQCFRIGLRNALFSLDITGLNLPPGEREELKTAEVTALSVGENGWLATVDSYQSKHFGSESSLKFWKFDEESGHFVLNTRVENPHLGGEVLGIAFGKQSPGGIAVEETLFFATVSSDGLCKLWQLADDSSIYETKEAWSCGVGWKFHKHPEGRCCAFSSDATVLAVGFGPFLTGWKTEDGAALFCENVNKNDPSDMIQQIVWGSKQSGEEHIALVRARHSVSAWDCLNGGALWTISEPSLAICLDRIAGHIALVQESEVKLLNASSSEPILIVHTTCADTVAAVFVPEIRRVQREEPEGRLYLLNKSQELFCLCPSSEAEWIESRGVYDFEEQGETAFLALVKESQVNDEEMEAIDAEERQKSNLKLLAGPAHAQPPLKTLAASFILSCLAEKPQA